MVAVISRIGETGGAFALVWRNAWLRRIAVARLVTVSGRWATTVALSVYVFIHGGASAVGLLALCRILPAMIAGPITAGALGRVRSDRMLLGAGVVRTLTLAGTALLVVDRTGSVSVLALVGAEALIYATYRPLQSAALPFLASTPRELMAANQALTTIESSGKLLGPLLGGLILSFASTGAVMFVTAASCAIATALIAAIPAWETPRPTDSGREAESGGTRAGLRAIHGDASLRLVVALYCAENFVTGGLNVLLVICAIKLLSLGSSGLGLLNGVIGAGGMVGAIAVGAVLGPRRIASNLGTGLFLCGAPIAIVAARPGTAATLVLFVVLGAGITICDFTAVTLLQRAISDDALAGVFSVLQSVFVATLGLGTFLAPELVSALGLRATLGLLGVGLIIPVALSWSSLARLDGGYLRTEEAADLLRSISIFEPLDLPTIERLARALIPFDAPAGNVIIQEGDEGDRYYAIAAGELLVSIDGQPVRTLHRGDGFGEIALLRGVPRTSTVTASTDVRLLALERETFLAAVAGHPESRNAAEAIIDIRLGSLRAGLASV